MMLLEKALQFLLLLHPSSLMKLKATNGGQSPKLALARPKVHHFCKAETPCFFKLFALTFPLLKITEVIFIGIYHIQN